MSPKSYSPKNLLDYIQTRNQSYRTLIQQVQKVTSLDTPLLLMGESGTGKDYLAEAVHHSSHRSHGPFIKVDCGSIPKDLFESELFGYEKGAFTDAYETKLGKLELAQGGTVYLDNIGALSLDLQAKLLRVFEDKTFSRLGSHATIHIDVRFIVSSIMDLKQMVREGLFRKDLFYRLNVLAFTLSPLRERRDDIPYLASIFARDISARYSRKIQGLTKDTHSILIFHSWRGNIRELKNAIERAVIMCGEDRIYPHHLPMDTFVEEDLIQHATREQWNLEQLEEAYIRQVLHLLQFNQTRAARVLGISRKTLLEKRKRYGIKI
ncbi:MAG TPA: sigma-54 dependent transcriptional regulator [Thermoanaerobaculia bacterium]|nr:sigma-54 dependent transcriptional regulator [Thermoanaerobaculia bacterium]HUM29365.1 sigma-54 dependent transcriptional regulator [Thermoanaerobaculia bacterium]HXK67611.1 sigma-54 dependent transcriptional regulator [Thermoanaerobaculia bacterium]